MSALQMVCLAIGTPLAGIAVYDIQSRLEHWVEVRHAND